MNEALPSRHRILLRTGALGAIVGALVSVGAGMGFGNLTNEVGTEEVFRFIAARPPGYWPTVHLAFIIGAFLWIGAFVALAASFTRDVSWALGRLAAAAIIVGGAVHVTDSSISGGGLAPLAQSWATAPASDQAELLRVGDTLLYALSGTWWSVHTYFHGLPFVLAGLAVVASRSYPAWLGWIGVAGGTASLTAGVLQFLGALPGSERLVIVPAQLVSLWMVAIGVLMWRSAARSAEASGDEDLKLARP
jgi:hypothetical protein